MPEDNAMTEAQLQPDDDDTTLPNSLPLIVANDPDAEEDDRTTQNISEVPEPAEGSSPDKSKDEAMSSPTSLHPVSAADGTIFMMEDVPLRSSLGGAQSDVSMPTASETEQHDIEQPSHETAGELHGPQPVDTGTNDQMKLVDDEDVASDEADTGGRSDLEDLDLDQYSDTGKTSHPDDDL